MSRISKITKIGDFDKPSIWFKITKMAQQTQSVNLGQGFPDWKAPEFFYESLQRNVTIANANQQYSRSFGNLRLMNIIANKYKESFNRNLNPLTEITIGAGGSTSLYNAITALVNPGDEVAIVEPFFDIYRPQIEFSGGILKGIPLKPPKKPFDKNKANEVLNYELDENKYHLNPNISNILKDNKSNSCDWELDFDLLNKTLNDKTKLLILNSPNNPTGKIISDYELKEISKIVKKFPNLIIISDEVYEHQIFDNWETLPRIGKDLFDRTLTVFSAGKLFSATGTKIGWTIGPEKLINKINAIHQYSIFCLYEPLQITFADCLEKANEPYRGMDNYFSWVKLHYANKRNYLLKNLMKSEALKDLDFYVPFGGFFIILGIKNTDVVNKNYGFEEDNPLKEKDFQFSYSKDFNFCLNLIQDRKVAVIPCSPFYSKENKHIGEDYIRIAICKEQATMDAAIEKLN